MSPQTLDTRTWIQQGALAADAWRLLPPPEIRRGPAGSHLLNKAGASLDFHDFREYQPGDDLRQVDWGVYARSDSLVIRQYREEVSPVVEIFLDTSASMGLYPAKTAAALFAASFIAGLARKSEGRPVLVTEGHRHIGAGVEPGLMTQDFNGKMDITTMPQWARASGRPVRFILTDFLFPADMQQLLTPLARDVSRLVLVQILARSERRPSLNGGVRFLDAEDQTQKRDVRVDAGALSRYRQRLEKHLALLDDAARRLNATLVRLDEPDSDTHAASLTERCTGALQRAGVIDVG